MVTGEGASRTLRICSHCGEPVLVGPPRGCYTPHSASGKTAVGVSCTARCNNVVRSRLCHPHDAPPRASTVHVWPRCALAQQLPHAEVACWVSQGSCSIDAAVQFCAAAARHASQNAHTSRSKPTVTHPRDPRNPEHAPDAGLPQRRLAKVRSPPRMISSFTEGTCRTVKSNSRPA